MIENDQAVCHMTYLARVDSKSIHLQVLLFPPVEFTSVRGGLGSLGASGRIQGDGLVNGEVVKWPYMLKYVWDDSNREREARSAEESVLR